MPIIKSAKKRVRVAAKAKARNSILRRQIRAGMKAYSKAITSGKVAEITKTQQELISALDSAAKKNVIHANKAARLKSRISAQAKKAGVKPLTSRKSKVTSPKPVKSKPKTASRTKKASK